MAFTFTKDERLTGLKVFSDLTVKGSAFFSHPFRIVWMNAEENQKFPARVAFAVPKRNFKSAVKRNRIKRLLRECYRLHKNELYSGLNEKNVKITAMFIYTQRDMPEFDGLESKIILSLQRLVKAADGSDRNG